MAKISTDIKILVNLKGLSQVEISKLILYLERNGFDYKLQ